MTRPNTSVPSWSRRRARGWMYAGLAASVWALLSATACGGGQRRPVAPAPTPGGGSASVTTLCETGEDLLRQRDFVAAAETLDRCIAANPRRAYAYYYAGMAYRQLDRVDLMADRFDTFVRLAPDAPERPQVETILNTLR